MWMLFGLVSPQSEVPEVVLNRIPPVILSSMKLKPGIYTQPDSTGKGAIQVGADNVVIDFQGGTLQSPSVLSGRMETYNGIGVAINGHKNVTIRRARIHGYQFNIKALKAEGLRIEDCEVGQSRSQRIMEKGSPKQIWLNLRGLDSWRTYGAGVWLEDCLKPIVKGVRANQSQNGLVMVHSSYGKVSGCDFSFNSGWGIALCRSSDNIVAWNHADFVNRPWAGGWGGDSSGFTVTTQSHRNIFAFNSFTHGGDGFFLTSKDFGFDGKDVFHAGGGCSGNWVVRNDGSFSSNNAFESTFSTKNVFYRNVANNSNYGFWLGYSKGNIIDGNVVIGSHEDGIATEQGSGNIYVANKVEDTGNSAIHLWSAEEPKYQQLPSTENYVLRNQVTRAKKGLDIKGSTKTTVQDNSFLDAPVASDITQTHGLGKDELVVPRKQEVMNLKPKGFRMYDAMELPRGWEWLSASEYGMRDYRKMLVPWTMKDQRTLRLFVRQGTVKKVDLPNWMEVLIQGNRPNEWLVSPKSGSDTLGENRHFHFPVIGPNGRQEWIDGEVLDLQWDVKWFAWRTQSHSAYQDRAGWDKLFSGKPLKEEVLPDLPAITGYQSPEMGLPKDHYAFTAKTEMTLDAGRYRFDTISDDGIQVLVDGKLVVNDWSHHGANENLGAIRLSKGRHQIEVRYCQEDGGAALSVRWSRIGN